MIQEVSTYINEVKSVLSEWKFEKSTYLPWFRGEEDINWNLRPSIYRNHNLNYYERELIRDFKNQASSLIKDNYPKNEFDWLFLMQHYGLPTRLLDFTESSLVALFFAVMNYKNTATGRVWIVDPMSLNRLTIGEQSIPYFTNPILKNFLLDEPILLDRFSEGEFNVNRQIKAELPVAVRPVRNNIRSIAQKATFIIYGRNPNDLNDIIESCRKNEKKRASISYLEIDGKFKLSILKELAICGISKSVVFPELSGIADEIKQNLSEDFVGYIRKREFIELKK